MSTTLEEAEKSYNLFLRTYRAPFSSLKKHLLSRKPREKEDPKKGGCRENPIACTRELHYLNIFQKIFPIFLISNLSQNNQPNAGWIFYRKIFLFLFFIFYPRDFLYIKKKLEVALDNGVGGLLYIFSAKREKKEVGEFMKGAKLWR